MITYLWIAIGSALGGMGRYALSGLVANAFGQTFPWGTLVINVTGSFVIGFFATLSGPDGRVMVPGDIRQFVIVGLCGGYTTFSSFSLQTLDLLRNGAMVRAAINVVASVVLCVIAVAIGHFIATGFNATPRAIAQLPIEEDG